MSRIDEARERARAQVRMRGAQVVDLLEEHGARGAVPGLIRRGGRACDRGLARVRLTPVPAIEDRVLRVSAEVNRRVRQERAIRRPERRLRERAPQRRDRRQDEPRGADARAIAGGLAIVARGERLELRQEGARGAFVSHKEPLERRQVIDTHRSVRAPPSPRRRGESGSI